MNKALKFPWLIVPFIYGIFIIATAGQIKTFDELYLLGQLILNVLVCAALLAFFQYLLIELYHQRQADTFISYLDYLGRTNKHLAAMKNKSYMAHAKDWKFSPLDPTAFKTNHPEAKQYETIDGIFHKQIKPKQAWYKRNLKNK